MKKSQSFQLGEKVILLIISLLFFTVLLRVFVDEVYRITSESMEGTLRIGDQVIVSKLHFGPKLPQTLAEIPRIGVIAGLMKDSPNSHYDLEGYNRLPGFTYIRNGDLIVLQRRKQRPVNLKAVNLNAIAEAGSSNTRLGVKIHIFTDLPPY